MRGAQCAPQSVHRAARVPVPVHPHLHTSGHARARLQHHGAAQDIPRAEHAQHGRFFSAASAQRGDESAQNDADAPHDLLHLRHHPPPFARRVHRGLRYHSDDVAT